MKKTIGKIFGVTFFVVMMLCITTLFASAETHKYNGKEYEIQTEGDFSYFVVTDENALTEWDKEHSGVGAFLYKYNGTAASVAIPSTLGGQPVIEIYCSAFEGNKALQTVTIGESVNLIAINAFKNCTGLQTVLIAKNVEAIDGDAFLGCSALKSVTFQKGSKLVSIEYGVFNGCTSLNNFTIPETVEIIGDWAFYNCDSMTDIVIPDSVTTLGAGAFFGCNSLVNATIGNSIETLVSATQGTYSDNGIGNWGRDKCTDGTFEGCISLANVTIGSAVKTIEADCFAGCGITSIVIPDNVETIETGAFRNCSSMITADIGDGVTKIGHTAFAYCSKLETVTVKGNNTVIEDGAFEGDTSLVTIDLSSNVISIGAFAFYNCDSMKELVIPSSVTYLGGGAVFGCDSLEKATIGNGVTDLNTATQGTYSDNGIGNWGINKCSDGTFEGCTKLKEVVIGSAVLTIGEDCFAGTALEKVDIPDNVITINAAAFRNCTKLEEVVIGNGVTSIANDAFRGDTSLTDVTIGSGVVSIGSWAFMDCTALPEIYVPSNVTTLGSGAFWNCSSLEKAVVGNGVTHLNTATQGTYSDNGIGNWGSTKLADGTFEGCVKLSSITLGSGIIAIGQDTFAGTQVTTLTVPGKVSTISTGAFAGATQLKDIYFTGNWAASVGDSIFNNIAEGYTVHYIANKIGYDDLAYNKATFTPVTVTFDNNSEDVFAAPTETQVLAPVGGYVIEPINPTAFGYHFVGWYKDAACTQKWDFENDKVTADTTIYAKWNSVDDVVPLRPENISTSDKDGSSITLKWSAVDGATGYNVYVNGVKHNDSTIFTTEYKVTGLDSSTTYEFVVRAVNSKGESPDSLIYADRTNDHVHEYGEWTVTKEATCAEDGEQTRTCECGATEKEAIPATGEHVYGEWVVTAEPTCSEDGSKESACATCDDKKTEAIPATGVHTFGEWVIIEEPTETSAGAREHTCTVCGAVEAEEIPMLAPHEHVYGDWVVTVEPTCGDKGEREAVCSCGDKKTEEIPVTDAHSFGEWEIIEEPTETAVGIREHVCTVCGKAEAEEIPMLSSGIKGDVNGDGRVTAADARLVLRAAARVETLSDNAMALAEVTGDGRVTAADARKILRVAAKVDEF